MLGRFGQVVDLRCHYVTCTSPFGKQWRGIAATDRDLWDRIEVRVCEDCIGIISEGERERGWILRCTPEGTLYFDIPWIQMLWGRRAR